MPVPRVRYISPDEDSGRWDGFPFRAGDIVISTRSKSGTTWMQMICALLVFQDPDLPAPLSQLSPWLDYQGDNLDRDRLAQLTGQPVPTAPRPPGLSIHDWLLDWVGTDADPRQELDSLPGVMHHVSDAWARRGEPNIVLSHYDDLSADLDREMRRLAGRLGIDVPVAVWPSLVEAATFGQMRAHADVAAPDPSGVLKDRAAFFRRGTSGAGRELLTNEELAMYHARTARMAPPDLLGWLHRDGVGRGLDGTP